MKHSALTGFVCTTLVMMPAAFAAHPRECPVSKPVQASYTWNFSREANGIFSDIQRDAWQARYHAERLQSMVSRADSPSWLSDVNQLGQISSAVNDMGEAVCRLETIRRAVLPWQQRAIDRVVTAVRLMGNYTQDAIDFGDHHRETLWMPTYQTYVNNLYAEAKGLTQSLAKAAEHAKPSA